VGWFSFFQLSKPSFAAVFAEEFGDFSLLSNYIFWKAHIKPNQAKSYLRTCQRKPKLLKREPQTSDQARVRFDAFC